MTQAPVQPNYAGPPPSSSHNNGLSIASLICGIIALVLCWIPCVNLISPLLGLAAIVLGIIGWVMAAKQPNEKPILAIIGIICAVVAFIGFFVSYWVLGAAAQKYGDQIGEGIQQTGVLMSAEGQAQAIKAQAQARGVDQDVIDQAYAQFESQIEPVNSAEDFDADQAQETVDAALEQLRATLETAPATAPPALPSGNSAAPPGDTGDGNGM